VIPNSQKEYVMLIAADRESRQPTPHTSPAPAGSWRVDTEASRPAGLTSRGPATLVTGVGLIAAMAVGSLVMWIGVPLGLIWFASHLQTGAEPSMGPYLVVAFGLPTLMIPLGKALASLDRAFSRVSGYTPENRRVRLPWLQSMRGERGSSHRATVLDVLMIVSVAIASAAFLFWFLFLAGSSLPA
jgi:hypothetical protein